MAPQLGVRLTARSGDPELVHAAPVPADPDALNPREYSSLLPGCDPDHLFVADCPFSHCIEDPVVIIYDASSCGPDNTRASRLTTNILTGDKVPIKGDGIVLFQKRSKDFALKTWEALDNCIYDELLEYFGQGLKPTDADVQRLVKEFKQGKFNYPQYVEMLDEDRNMDDGSSLPGWG